MTSSRYLAALSLAALLAACGSDSSKKGLDDVKDFAAAYADVMCTAQVNCSCADPKGKTDCTLAYQELLLMEVEQQYLEHPGTLFDKAAAKACVAEAAALLAACPSPTPSYGPEGSVPALAASRTLAPRGSSGPSGPATPESCAEVFVGTRAEGQFCRTSADCTADLTCDLAAQHCVARPGLDASCETTRDSDEHESGCAAGLYCDGDDLCAKIPAVDEACDADVEVCAEGSRCLEVEGEYKCVAPHGVDASCVADGAGCAAGLYCDRAGSGSCKALIADGGDCTSGSQCAHAWCNASHKCADPGFCSIFRED